MSRKPEKSFASKSIATLYLNTDLADVNFVFKIDEEVEKVPAQKYILASASPVFHTMFFGSIKEKDIVKIADSNPGAFKELLQFIYLEEVTLTMDNMEEVVRLADKYDLMECLNNYAASFIEKLPIENMCWGYQLAIIAKHDELKAYCEKIICALPDDVFKSTTFLNCDRKVLQHILQLDGLSCNETRVFDACISWAKFNCQQLGIDENQSENLKTELGDCFHLIRFATMTIEEFVKHTVPYYEMFTHLDLANVLYKTANEFTPNKFNANPRSMLIFQWKDEEALTCFHSNSAGTSTNYYIQSLESSWFSSNVPLVLGKLDCYSLRYQGSAVNLNLTISIIEIGAQSFEVIAPIKVLHKSTMVFSGNNNVQVSLPQPVIINPRKMYEVRLEGQVSANYYYYSSFGSKSESRLNEKTLVKFHRNPSSEDRYGLVSHFYFNQF